MRPEPREVVNNAPTDFYLSRHEPHAQSRTPDVEYAFDDSAQSLR